MLSEKFGYKYHPGHLRNCDFNAGLEHWEVQAAAAHSVKKTSFPGYGRNSQRRWGAPPNTGDDFCLLTRCENKANSISQTATGLSPGKLYTLQFVTADYQDMLLKRFNPRQHQISAEFSAGAELLPEQCYVYVENRSDKKQPRLAGHARVNLHYVRFRALQDSLKITFSDEKAGVGEELALNYIVLRPYHQP
ncbi:MAG: hypothetical protein WCS95_09430 [Lentisphaeria bacterium]|jgi:hypothetical protein|nr:hypothetical protein [Lentisphaeria bacterium]NLZ60981.1 hypothetical protein [Lentisphaerota bacterium]